MTGGVGKPVCNQLAFDAIRFGIIKQNLLCFCCCSLLLCLLHGMADNIKQAALFTSKTKIRVAIYYNR